MTQAKPDIAAVFFDMDETLIRHTRDWMQIIHDIYAEYAEALEGIEESLFMQTLGQKATDMWNMMFDGVLSGEVAGPYTFKNTLRALERDDSLAEAMRDTFERLMIDATVLAPHAAEVIAGLKDAGCTVGVITNGYTTMQSRKLQHHGIDEMVDHILISEAIGAHKPDIRIFEAACERAGATPERIVHVGDHLENDVHGAIQAGMTGVLIDPEGERRAKIGENPELSEPTHIVESLAEILPIAGVRVLVAKD